MNWGNSIRAMELTTPNLKISTITSFLLANNNFSRWRHWMENYRLLTEQFQSGSFAQSSLLRAWSDNILRSCWERSFRSHSFPFCVNTECCSRWVKKSMISFCAHQLQIQSKFRERNAVGDMYWVAGDFAYLWDNI